MSQRLDAEQTDRLLEALAKAGWVRRSTTSDAPGKRGPKHQRWLVDSLAEPRLKQEGPYRSEQEANAKHDEKIECCSRNDPRQLVPWSSTP
jgi:hypothetical protein